MEETRKEMTQEREGRILQTAVDTWGHRKQIVKAMEEMGELTQALSKWMIADRNKFSLDDLTAMVREEMADVSIMLNQMALIFGDPVEEEIRKLERLELLLVIENT